MMDSPLSEQLGMYLRHKTSHVYKAGSQTLQLSFTEAIICRCQLTKNRITF